MEEMISEKKDLLVGSSGSSNIFEWESQSADWRISHNRFVPCVEDSSWQEALFFFPQLSITEIIHYLAGRVDKEIALLGMELRGSDNLKEQHLLTPAPPRSAWVRQISPLWVPPCWQAWCRRCWRTDRWSPCATSWCVGHRQRDKFPGEKKDDRRKAQSGERYLVRVDRYWIDVVGVGVGKYPPENGNNSANYWKTIRKQDFQNEHRDVSSTRPHLGLASTISSMGLRTGTLRALMELGSLWRKRVIV